jgi:hypothetical protein
LDRRITHRLAAGGNLPKQTDHVIDPSGSVIEPSQPPPFNEKSGMARQLDRGEDTLKTDGVPFHRLRRHWNLWFVSVIVTRNVPARTTLPAALLQRMLSSSSCEQSVWEVCGKRFVRRRISRKYCSDKCRQQRYGDRRRIAGFWMAKNSYRHRNAPVRHTLPRSNGTHTLTSCTRRCAQPYRPRGFTRSQFGAKCKA